MCTVERPLPPGGRRQPRLGPLVVNQGRSSGNQPGTDQPGHASYGHGNADILEHGDSTGYSDALADSDDRGDSLGGTACAQRYANASANRDIHTISNPAANSTATVADRRHTNPGADH
jgi:hypothetical protein